MKEVDFHGWTLSDAESEMHQIIGAARMTHARPEQVQFITGVGQHKEQVLEIAKKYGLEANEKIGNTGCVIVLIN